MEFYGVPILLCVHLPAPVVGGCRTIHGVADLSIHHHDQHPTIQWPHVNSRQVTVLCCGGGWCTTGVCAVSRSAVGHGYSSGSSLSEAGVGRPCWGQSPLHTDWQYCLMLNAAAAAAAAIEPWGRLFHRPCQLAAGCHWDRWHACCIWLSMYIVKVNYGVLEIALVFEWDTM